MIKAILTDQILHRDASLGHRVDLNSSKWATPDFKARKMEQKWSIVVIHYSLDIRLHSYSYSIQYFNFLICYVLNTPVDDYK